MNNASDRPPAANAGASNAGAAKAGATKTGATKPGQVPAASSRAEIDTFLDRVKSLGPATTPAGGRGRLIFALDATMSRQPTWDTACRLQADMFREAAAVGGLDIQLVYYRGLAECRASSFVAQPERLRELMSRIDCRGGQTQIGKVLAHAQRENERGKVAVVVFIGDAMEEIARRAVRRGRRARFAQCPRLHVPGGLRHGLRAGVPRSGAADARRILPLLARLGA